MNWYDNDTGVDNYTPRTMSLPLERFAHQNGISRIGYLPNSYEFYTRYVRPLPKHVITPTTISMSRLCSIFGTDSEMLLVKIINAISEKTSSNLRIANIAGGLYKDFNRYCHDHSVHYLDSMIVIEQAGLDLRDILIENGFYIHNRWMPYAYETIFRDGGLLLKRPNSFEDFCDTHPWAAGIDEYLMQE